MNAWYTDAFRQDLIPDKAVYLGVVKALQPPCKKRGEYSRSLVRCWDLAKLCLKLWDSKELKRRKYFKKSRNSTLCQSSLLLLYCLLTQIDKRVH